MAGQIIDAVVAGVKAKTGSLPSEHISSVWGFKEEIGKLQVSLTKVQAVLHDAEKRQVSDESVKIWLRQLKDVAYEADDVLDEYDYEILQQKVETQNQVRSFFSSSNPVVFRVKMAKRIKTINESLDEIKKDISLLGLIASSNPIPQTGLDRETDSFIDGSEVVGRRDDVLKIVDLLVGANNQQVISVIPIVGMAGLGKTTIAKLVYNDKRVKNHFDEKIWVCVSENFDVKRILREILEALDHNCSGLETKNALLQHLQKKLQGKRYLLILDDVWDEDREKWDSLRSSLLGVNQNNGNNILVTTRKDNVAQIMKTSLVHKLEKLSEDECWLIFKEKAFPNERIPVTLEDIGRKIAKRCGGNPLAARVLGGMMHLKEDKSEWLLIQNSKTWDSMEDNNGVFPILKLSFDHLPTPSLKQCFAYCSIFPKDFIIEKKLLVQLWMAEGFLQTSKRSFLVIEDIGNKYFDFLVANSLFQDLERDFYGGIRSCKMHDLVHDLALSISERETLHLEGNLGDDIDVSHTRRLSLISDGHTTPAIPLSEDGMGRLRTVFLNHVDLGDKLLGFKCVRVLSLSGSCIKELPESIGKLRHLRLLRIEHTYIKLIPNSVTMLYNLQTLVIKNCRLLEELPKDLRNLINLRHIDIDHHYYIKQLQINMGQLTCLQTLPFFAIGQDIGYRIEELGCLSQLKEELCIYNLEHVRDKEEAKTANLAVKSKLHKLGFYWGWYKGEGNNNDENVMEGLQPHPNLKSLEIGNFNGEKFPSWLVGSDNIRGGLLFLDHLLEICLSHCTCEKIPTLGHLPSLKVLKIEGMDNVRCIGTEFYSCYNGEGSSNGIGGSGNTVLFPALERLDLFYMVNLVEWNGVTGSTAEIGMIFPRLEHLQVSQCKKLTSAPSHFPSLNELYINEIRGPAFEKIISELTTLTSLNIQKVSELACLPKHFLEKNTSLMNLNIWSCDDLESILPHEHVWPICTSLRSLSIYDCDKLSTLPDALHNLHCLEDIKVKWCRNLGSFPSIQGIASFLQHLEISCCDEVLPTGLQSCMSLQYLIICNCPHLISIPDLRNLHSLTHLNIYRCPNLKSIPDLKELPSLTRLDIGDCSNLILIPDLQEYPSLIGLNISGCSNLISIPDLRELHSLTHLKICKCQKLRCVLDGLECLTRLKCLWIGDICKELNSFPSLNSILHSHAPLKSLYLHGWDSLNSLPEAIKYFTALQILKISEFGEMISLPDWLGNLSSLQMLCIYYCKNMMYLPTMQAMRRLIKLEELEIWKCPKLEERCAKGSGAEWPKIADIPIFTKAWCSD